MVYPAVVPPAVAPVPRFAGRRGWKPCTLLGSCAGPPRTTNPTAPEPWWDIFPHELFRQPFFRTQFLRLVFAEISVNTGSGMLFTYTVVHEKKSSPTLWVPSTVTDKTPGENRLPQNWCVALVSTTVPRAKPSTMGDHRAGILNPESCALFLTARARVFFAGRGLHSSTHKPTLYRKLAALFFVCDCTWKSAAV